MRTLLAYAPHRDTFGYSMPPPGLLRLGGELRRRGLVITLVDLAHELAAGRLPADETLAHACAERLLAGGPPQVLGLSTVGATVPIALAIARQVRNRARSVRVVLGGPGVGGIDEALLSRFPQIDAVVRGEGEQTLPELLGRWAAEQDPAGVAGVTWRDRRGAVRREPARRPLADLDELAEPAWDLLPSIADYKRITGEEDGLVPIDSGRGCIYNCTFCSIGRFWDRRSRPLPAGRLVREVLAIRSLPAAKRAYLCHDIFGADREHALEFCRRMIAAGAPVPWECRARVDHLDEELVAQMAAAGCYRVLLGVESADGEVLDRCEKRLRGDPDVLVLVRGLLAHGITPILSLMLGLPDEDDDALEATLALAAAASLAGGVHLSLHLPNPQPGCTLGDEYAGRGIRLAGIEPDMARGAGGTGPERRLIEAHPDLFSTWALLPWEEGRLRELADLAARLPAVLMRYPRTFTLLARNLGARGEPRPALTLFRTWAGDGRSFEAFARRRRDPAVDSALAWEQALVRAAARGPAPGAAKPQGPDARPIAAAEVLHLSRDVDAALAGRPASGPTHLAVLATERGTATARVGAGVAQALDLCDGRRTLAALEVAHPGAQAALCALSREGLVRFLPPASGSSESAHAGASSRSNR